MKEKKAERLAGMQAEFSALYAVIQPIYKGGWIFGKQRDAMPFLLYSITLRLGIRPEGKGISFNTNRAFHYGQGR